MKNQKVLSLIKKWTVALTVLVVVWQGIGYGAPELISKHVVPSAYACTVTYTTPSASLVYGEKGTFTISVETFGIPVTVAVAASGALVTPITDEIVASVAPLTYLVTDRKYNITASGTAGDITVTTSATTIDICGGGQLNTITVTPGNSPAYFTSSDTKSYPHEATYTGDKVFNVTAADLDFDNVTIAKTSETIINLGIPGIGIVVTIENINPGAGTADIRMSGIPDNFNGKIEIYLTATDNIQLKPTLGTLTVSFADSKPTVTITSPQPYVPSSNTTVTFTVTDTDTGDATGNGTLAITSTGAITGLPVLPVSASLVGGVWTSGPITIGLPANLSGASITAKTGNGEFSRTSGPGSGQGTVTLTLGSEGGKKRHGPVENIDVSQGYNPTEYLQAFTPETEGNLDEIATHPAPPEREEKKVCESKPAEKPEATFGNQAYLHIWANKIILAPLKGGENPIGTSPNILKIHTEFLISNEIEKAISEQYKRMLMVGLSPFLPGYGFDTSGVRGVAVANADDVRSFAISVEALDESKEVNNYWKFIGGSYNENSTKNRSKLSCKNKKTNVDNLFDSLQVKTNSEITGNIVFNGSLIDMVSLGSDPSQGKCPYGPFGEIIQEWV